MYEELVRCLREHAKPWNCADNCICKDATQRGYGSCSDELAKLAADAIEELSKLAEVNAKRAMKWAADAEKAEETLRWIPVTERLPEEKRDGFSDDVLMLVENPDGDITWKDVYVGYYLYDATSAETGWWAMMTCDCVKIGEHKYGSKVFPANEYVTHWQPLPELPEEEE